MDKKNSESANGTGSLFALVITAGLSIPFIEMEKEEKSMPIKRSISRTGRIARKFYVWISCLHPVKLIFRLSIIQIQSLINIIIFV